MSKLKKSIFTGAATAIITPFKNGVIDYDSFGKIIEFQATAEGNPFSKEQMDNMYTLAKKSIDKIISLY